MLRWFYNDYNFLKDNKVICKLFLTGFNKNIFSSSLGETSAIWLLATYILCMIRACNIFYRTDKL